MATQRQYLNSKSKPSDHIQAHVYVVSIERKTLQWNIWNNSY